MAKENGKDKDGFENVEGKAPEEKPLLGMRVTGGSFGETEGDGVRVTIDVKGTTLGDLVKKFGQDVHVETVNGARRVLGHVTEIKLKEGKEQGSRVVSAKVIGGLELAKLAGNQVRLQKAQGELPLGGEASAEDTPRRRRGREAQAGPDA
jgi:hypothetical protein